MDESTYKTTKHKKYACGGTFFFANPINGVFVKMLDITTQKGESTKRNCYRFNKIVAFNVKRLHTAT